MCDTGFTSLPHHVRIQCWVLTGPPKLSCSDTCWQTQSSADQRCWWCICLCHKNLCSLWMQSHIKKKRHEKVVNSHFSTKSFEYYTLNSFLKVCNFPWKKTRIYLFWCEIKVSSIHWVLVAVLFCSKNFVSNKLVSTFRDLIWDSLPFPGSYVQIENKFCYTLLCLFI